MTPAQVHHARTTLGMTQQEFADALGLGPYGFSTVCRWERTTRTAPIRKSTVRKIEALLTEGAAP